MKLRFKKQTYQTAAVEAVADCFAGQQKSTGINYRIDPGVRTQEELLAAAGVTDEADAGFKNADLSITGSQVLKNLQEVQRRQNLTISSKLISNKVCPYNFDIEMETGTGKTYCYIKSMFEMNSRYGWSKFIVVVPSIAIREGVQKSFSITADHFLEDYGKRARPFVYSSKALHNLESFSSDAGINVMIINVQAFNATGKDARRIYEELDDFQSRRPIDVIAANRPILILDEPQKMEGKKTVDSLAAFNPLFIFRYSATHKTEYNKIHRLDALDAYNQKLVKKIAVRGITVRGLTGTNAYLYVGGIQIATTKPPTAKVELEIKQASGIKRVYRNLGRNDNLYELSGKLDQYKGYVISDIDAIKNTVSFSNGVELEAGDAVGDVNDLTLRRIQIREAIRAHFEKEYRLFKQGIKVLTLFFIDEVAKYRQYDANGEVPGEYASIFEEEYGKQLAENQTLFDDEYDRYLKGIDVSKTHNGYFSIDRKTNRLVNPEFKTRGETAGETDDIDAYDLILKDKETLLSYPNVNDDDLTRAKKNVRFIFSHSALREGWDNPNVFVICTLKHSDNTISRRQEVGRGMRIAVNQFGERADDPATVHETNILTVIASESYKDFVTGLQKDISESLSARPRKADKTFFAGKIIQTDQGPVAVTPEMANAIYRYLVKNDYTTEKDEIAKTYHAAKEAGTLAELPAELKPYAEQVFKLVDSVFSDDMLPKLDDDRKSHPLPLNDNFKRKEFQELWQRINKKAAYTVHFESEELVRKCISCLDVELKITYLQYVVQGGIQRDNVAMEDLKKKQGFIGVGSSTDFVKESANSAVEYDLVGKICEGTQLTRRTICEILGGVAPATFNQFKSNPEDFIAQAVRLINEQKATVIVQHLAYDSIAGKFDNDIFTREKGAGSLDKAFKADRHILDYVFCDSGTELNFVTELDQSTEVIVYAKLPRSFFIPTPVGNYSPDWAIAFEAGKVKHVYFVAETKGSMSTMQLKHMESCKVECARKFFAKVTSDQVKFDIVDSYAKLSSIVGVGRAS